MMADGDPIGGAAAAIAERLAAGDAAAESAPATGPFAVTGLHGNSATLVEIDVARGVGAAGISLVSRDRQARASFTPPAGEKLIVPLPDGDYLVAARLAASADRRPDGAPSRRFLVSAGRAFGYAMPMPLPAFPAAHPALDAAVPVLKRLAYTGSVDGAARLVVEWSSGSAVHCLCIRSPLWGAHWLPYAIPVGGALCLRDGVYEIRAAALATDGKRRSGWSDVTEFVTAEGRLAAPPCGGGELLDWLAVKPGWRADDGVELHLEGTDCSTVAVRLRWQAAGAAAGLRYVIAYRPVGGGDWQTAIATDPEHTLRLQPGRYRIRICAVDDLVFLRSEFYGECIVTVSASDPPAVTHGAAPPVSDASAAAWVALPPGEASPGPDLAEFIARPVSSWADGRDPVAIDLNALAYGRSPQGGRQDADVAVTRALLRGLAPDQMAAAGDYFLRTGQLENARRIFEALGRRYRGVDFAQLRCAQLAAIGGRGDEARELLRMALSAPRNGPARSPGPAALPEARVQRALRAANAKTDRLIARTGSLQDALQEMPALRFKAQQYDRLTRELPVLRYKAKRYDEAKGRLTGGRQRGVVRLFRRLSVRLVGRRPH